MDEAERCHALAYIAYGKLLIQGTAQEVVRQAGLTTWSVEGDDLAALAHELRARPGIDMVVSFGTTLHVSGADAARLEDGIAPYRGRPEFRWSPADTSLEDVFIHMMEGAKDNFS
jgi:ABC-2 type transport system ATP-binding protein